MAYEQGMTINFVHVVVNGQGQDIQYDELDAPEHPSEAELRSAVEDHLDLEEGLLRNYQLDGYVQTGQVVLRPDAKLGADDEDEISVRSRVLDSLVRCPHRDMESILILHQDMMQADPEFYAHLAVWAQKNTKVRDHKEAFIATLFSSDHTELREVAYVLMQGLPAYQVARIKGHVEGQWKSLGIRVTKKSSADDKRKAAALSVIKKEALAAREGDKDLDVTPYYDRVRALFSISSDTVVRALWYRATSKTSDGKKRTNRVRFEAYQKGIRRRAPRIMRSAVTTYLRKLEGNSDRFDAATVRQAKALKSLYSGFRIKPSALADQVLFKDNPPPGSKRHAMKSIAKTDDPVEWAKAVVAAKIPFPVAVGLCPTAITPVHLIALINNMSSQELLNNLGALEARGAMDNADVKALIERKLAKAKKSKRVDALKAQKAADMVASKVDEETAKKIRAVTDAQVSSSVKIKKSTVLAIDSSSSMDTAIEVGKQIGAMVVPACQNGSLVCSFSDMPREHKVDDPTKLSQWEQALKFVRARGRTNVASILRLMERSDTAWEQIVLITDEGDNGSPSFAKALAAYRDKNGTAPNVVIVRLKGSNVRAKVCDRIEKGLQAEDLEVDVFDLTASQDKNGTIDYYSLPNLMPLLAGGSRTELLMDIMDIPLPSRSAWDAIQQATA